MLEIREIVISKHPLLGTQHSLLGKQHSLLGTLRSVLILRTFCVVLRVLSWSSLSAQPWRCGGMFIQRRLWLQGLVSCCGRHHQMMSKACSMWQRSCIHSFICSIDVVCGAGANDLLSLVQLYTVRRIQTQELESAIAVAVADVKTEPGTESQVAQVQLTPVPGLGLYTCMTA